MKPANGWIKFHRYRIVSTDFQVSESFDPSCSVNLNISHEVSITWQHDGVQTLQPSRNSDEKEQSNNLFFLCRLMLGISTPGDGLKVNVVTDGYFSMPDSISEEQMAGLSEKNAPAILYPFIRAYISSLTSLAGIPGILLPTIDLTRSGSKRS